MQALILAPSRELVAQIAQVGEAIFKGTGIKILSMIGGANVKGQVNRLRDDRPQIIVATPGRLAELVFGLKKLRLGTVRALIVDEVDNLLQEPFTGELEVLWGAMPLLNKISSSLPQTQPGRRRPDKSLSALVDFHDDSEEREDDDDEDNSFDDDFEDVFLIGMSLHTLSTPCRMRMMKMKRTPRILGCISGLSVLHLRQGMLDRCGYSLTKNAESIIGH